MKNLQDKIKIMIKNKDFNEAIVKNQIKKAVLEFTDELRILHVKIKNKRVEGVKNREIEAVLKLIMDMLEHHKTVFGDWEDENMRLIENVRGFD